MDITDVTRKSLIAGLIVVAAVLIAAFFLIRALVRMCRRALAARADRRRSQREMDEGLQLVPVIDPYGRSQWAVWDPTTGTLEELTSPALRPLAQ